ncbi:UbiA prenyltransferase family protein [Candidatus Woesearchaeota archaeon]|nr:UbiA prenyltransferase family protein [Candidatus Woesearchaeota archaeon]
MNKYVALLRPWQWYKNLIIGLALLFSGQLFQAEHYLPLLLGFLALCLVSSANYVINDLKDEEQDRHNPEKKDKPLASGKIGTKTALVIAAGLLVAGIGSSYLLSPAFALITGSLFLVTTVYTFLLKQEAFVDILAIATNFVLRAVGGAVVIGVAISPWLIIGTFFFALFLAVGKRAGEALLLKSRAGKHRKNLASYTPETTRFLMVISTTLLIMSYALFAFLSKHSDTLIVTLPFMLYPILRYFSLVEEGHEIARHPHLAFKDKRLLIGAAIFVLVTMLSLYVF